MWSPHIALRRLGVDPPSLSRESALGKRGCWHAPSHQTMRLVWPCVDAIVAHACVGAHLAALSERWALLVGTASPSRKKTAGHRNVTFARRQVIMRLFHLRVKLRTPIPSVGDGVGVVGAQSPPFQQWSALAGPPTPGQPAHDGQEQLSLEIWYLRRPETRNTSRNTSYPPCAWRWFLKPSVGQSLLQRRLPPASNGPCSSTKASCTRTSPYWRTKSNRRAPMSLHSVAV
ncbi:hypothetical protein TcCL_ESM08223 [Trypanosoma cruzi]|nr:hypothetical protein TcCL_ESM08223 [Trypanosoma cruzi]